MEILRDKDPAKRHVSEVATILRAKELGVQLVVMDDREARKRVARPRSVNTITTVTLAAEMTYRTALSEEQGWKRLSGVCARSDIRQLRERSCPSC